MIKKYICFFFLVFSFSIASFGQSISINDSRIAEVYGNFVSQLDSGQLAWLHTKLQRSEVKEIPFEQNETYPKLSSLKVITKYIPTLQMETVFDPANINALKYYIDFYQKTDQLFRIDNTNYVLLIKKKD